MPASTKLQALIHAGLITEDAAKKLPADFKKRVESLTDDEITHLCSVKAKLGQHTLGPNAMVSF